VPFSGVVHCEVATQAALASDIKDMPMKTLFIGNLATDATEQEITELFAAYGTVRKIELPRDIFTGRNKGFAFIDMEGHEARAAMSALNGKPFKDKMLKVTDEKPKAKGRGGRRR